MSVMSTADATPTNTTDLFNSHSSSKGKEKEDTTTYIVSQQSQGESDSYTKEDKLKKASGMLFGKQQDVTECMDNVMFQLEAALKSIMTNENAQAEREVTLITSPPILQIQRVQFDRSTSNIYKSNAYLRFEKAIYLDRYLDKNREILRNLIKEANEWRKEIDTLQEELKDFSRDKVIDLLKSSAEFVQSLKNEDFIMDENFGRELEEESDWVVKKINEYEGRINSLRYSLNTQYNHLTECKYLLHAVFIHSGQANFGHYWIYIYDFEKNRWLKYNDSYVDENEVFADTTGSSANPYCMVYVREQVC
ncbi:3334_t:CDS:2, partial [Diversispora eburnea]